MLWYDQLEHLYIHIDSSICRWLRQCFIGSCLSVLCSCIFMLYVTFSARWSRPNQLCVVFHVSLSCTVQFWCACRLLICTLHEQLGLGWHQWWIQIWVDPAPPPHWHQSRGWSLYAIHIADSFFPLKSSTVGPSFVWKWTKSFAASGWCATLTPTRGSVPGPTGGSVIGSCSGLAMSANPRCAAVGTLADSVRSSTSTMVDWKVLMWISAELHALPFIPAHA